MPNTLLLSSRPPVSIVDRVAHPFPGPVVVAGFALLKEGAVEIVETTATAVEARVKSKRTRTVKLRIERDGIAIGCTCAPSTMDPPACKHVFATFLEADRRHLLEPVRSAARPLRVTFLPMPTDPVTSPPPAPASVVKTKAKAKKPAKVEAKAKAPIKAKAKPPAKKPKRRTA